MPLKNIILLLLFLLSARSFSQSTASQNVRIFEIDALQLDTLRTIRIYLPEDYEQTQEHYPVLYMHDAQNLFDSTTAFSGEWKIDEFLDLQKGQKMIVVGIDHGNKKRISELTPFPNSEYGGGEGSAYIDFVVQNLKPHIDTIYRTLPGAENTAVMGSSLGGLISFYAALKHPEIFGKAGVFSPSFWFSDEIFSFAEDAELIDDSRFYFAAGTAESESMVHLLLRMKETLLKKGFPAQNLELKIVEEGEHKEAFWSSLFPEAVDWLFPLAEKK